VKFISKVAVIVKLHAPLVIVSHIVVLTILVLNTLVRHAKCVKERYVNQFVKIAKVIYVYLVVKAVAKKHVRLLLVSLAKICVKLTHAREGFVKILTQDVAALKTRITVAAVI
jgi:hypothetical protein